MANRLSKAEMSEFRKLLEKRNKVLSGDASTLEEKALKRNIQDSSGDLSSMPMHMADLGTDNFEQELTLGIVENEQDEIREINEALRRIKDGKFGLCESCSKPITKIRLRAVPYARLCIGCKKKEEPA
ncbi:MAG: hypothetical protein A2W23_05550 [Planctomycetes bacterium RBG_16_43_13]|nr:MAG: hypothetical protein A2W23_05550 [Planctomycetes bacterium RBG_16_43_13]